ncbi:MAG: hypothetical protein ACKVS9_13935 [Phycisphaerae bacterium]
MKWYHAYYLLAVFNDATVGLALYLNLLDDELFDRAILENHRENEVLTEISELSQVAIAAKAPP